jgi:hypothetical protein
LHGGNAATSHAPVLGNYVREDGSSESNAEKRKGRNDSDSGYPSSDRAKGFGPMVFQVKNPNQGFARPTSIPPFAE